MMFDSVSEAVSFAEEILERPVLTTMGAVIDRVPGKGSDLDYVRDIAHTISNHLGDVEQNDAPMAGKVFRYVFGKGDNEQLIRATMEISRYLMDNDMVEVKVESYQLRAMVLATLRESRLVELGMKAGRSFAWIGRECGCKCGKTFRRKHREIISAIRETIEQCLDICEARMEPRLKDSGYLPWE